MASAAVAGLVSCRACSLLTRPASPATPGHCPRCGEHLAWRHHHSIQRTWAFLIAAVILYVPANWLPVLTTHTLVSTQSDTILSGVVYLWATGSWPLALIVFIASVLVPLGKIFALAYVLVSVQRRSAVNNRQRTRLFRIVEFVGRWSMLDVFVDTYIVALVQLSPLMAVDPGPGVVYFMAVVILTMFAAQSFDPRLIWDAHPVPKGRPEEPGRHPLRGRRAQRAGGGQPTARGGPSEPLRSARPSQPGSRNHGDRD